MPAKKILVSGVMLLLPSLALVATPSAVAAATLPKVTVRVEGKTKTLLATTSVQTHSGWITKFGAPTRACPATSGQGALSDATHGNWKGSYSSTYDEYLITQILGETESGTKEYWEIFVNNVAAATGACQIKLHTGDQLLFAAVPSTGKAQTPLGISAPAHAAQGKAFRVKVVGYNAKGKPRPLAGATVSAGGTTARTNASGVATVTDKSPGRFVLTAKDTGYIRTEADVDVTPVAY